MENGEEGGYLKGESCHEDVAKWANQVEDIANVALVHAEMLQPHSTNDKEKRARIVAQSKFRILVAVTCCKPESRARILARNLQRKLGSDESCSRAEAQAEINEKEGRGSTTGSLWELFVGEMAENLGPRTRCCIG